MALRWKVCSTSIMCAIWNFYCEVISILSDIWNLADSVWVFTKTAEFFREWLPWEGKFVLLHYVHNMGLSLRSYNHFASYSKFGWFWTLPTEKLIDNAWLIIAQWPNYWLSIVSLFCGYKLSLLTRQAVIFDPQPFLQKISQNQPNFKYETKWV